MTPDMTPITNWLASLGPYGYLLAAALPVVLYLLRRKFGPLAQPVVPTPAPSPATTSPALAGRFPLASLFAAALGIKTPGRAATVADIPHDKLVQLRDEVTGLIEAKVEHHAAALADLQPEAEEPAAPPAAPK